LQAMNLTAKTVKPDVDEFELAELQAAACRQVDVPRVAAAEAHFECELMQSIQLGTGPGGANLVIGRIVWIEVDDRLIRDSGRLDETKLGTIGRMGGAGYVRTADRIELPRP
ncbi:MAG: flavin reductase, partial [Planctomycetota bacterium]